MTLRQKPNNMGQSVLHTIRLLSMCVAQQSSLKTVMRPGEGHLVFLENEVAVTRGRYGLSTTALSDQVVGQHLRELGEWEQAILDVAEELVPEGGTVWECGAHIGAHSIGLAAMVGDSGTVHVWEPQPEARMLLSATIALNGLSQRVHVHGDALGSVTDEGVRLRIRPCQKNDRRRTTCTAVHANNSGAFSMAEQVPLQRIESLEHTVKVTSLDKLFQDGILSGGCPKLIKSDVEGMDYRVLEGAEAAIVRCLPHLIFETMAPRRSWPVLVDALLSRHPQYTCSWLTFRIIPSEAHAYRIPGILPSGLDKAKRRGPMSFNAVCTANAPPEHFAPKAANSGLLLPAKNGATDTIYAGSDCLDYEVELKAAAMDNAVFSWVTGIAADTISAGARPSICQDGVS